MKLNGSGGQRIKHFKYDASGAIGAGGVAQLVLPVNQSRSSLFLQNNSTGALYFEIGGARAVATISGGAVTGASVSGAPQPGMPLPNAGFNYSYPPIVRFWGGGSANNSTYLGLGQPFGEAPSHPAQGFAVLSNGNGPLNPGNVVSIVITDPGAGYVTAPYVFLENSDLDPYGCAIPSNGVGVQVGAGGGAVTWNGTVCPTDSISVWGATTGQHFTVKWMD